MIARSFRVLASNFVGLLAVVFFVVSSLNGAPGWRQGGPEGADVQSIAVDPTHSDIVYLLSSGGVWKSTDAGAHWVSASKGLCEFNLHQIAVDPTRPGTLYVGGDEGLFRSTDAGVSWHISGDSNYPASVTSVSVDPRDLGIVYRGSYDGIFKSTDRGMTWTDSNGGTNLQTVVQILIDPANPDRVIARASYNGLFRTTDGGSTWTPSNSGLTTNVVTELALSGTAVYASTESKGVFKSTDFGTNWTPLFPQTGSFRFNTVAAHPTNPNIVFAGDSSGQVHRSTDGGANWEPFACSVGYYRQIDRLAVHRQNPAIIYAGGFSGFAVSTDGGAHWNQRNSGLAGNSIRSVVADDQDPLTFYAGTRYDGLWRTTDGGISWTSINQGMNNYDAYKLAKVPNSNVLYASMFDIGLQKSTDRGSTWVRVGQDQLTNYVYDLLVSPLNSTVYVLSNSVYASTDAGATWVKKSTGLPAGSGSGAIALDPIDPGTLYVGYYERGMFKTTDGGDTWTEIGSFKTKRIRSMFVDPWDANVVYAGTDGYLNRSTDKGATWSTSSPGLHGSIYALIKGPAKTVLVGTWQGGLYSTRDRGQTWSEVKPRVPTNAPILALALNPGGTMLIGTVGAGVFKGQYESANPLYFPQVADGVAGTLKLRSTLVLVNGGDETQATITFKNVIGGPMAIRLNDSPAQSVHTVNLKRLESVSLQTPGADPIQSGYAVVTSGPQVTGTVVFSFFENGVCMYESGVPATPAMYECSMLFDAEEAGRDVGLAVVSAAESGDAKITFRLFDPANNQLASKEVTELVPGFGAGHHLARYATQVFPEIKAQGITRGVVTVESDQPIAAVTLRQTDVQTQGFPQEVPTMCTFPVIDRRTQANHRFVSSEYIYFPQIANGTFGSDRYQTTLVLVNTGRTTPSVRVEFFGSDGQRLNLPLKDFGERNSVDVSVQRGHTLEIQTTGGGAVQAGYAKVWAPGDFGGTAVFTFWRDGIRLFEAGVPAVMPSRSQSVYLDNLEPGRDIGFALANTSTNALDVTFKLYDSTGTLKATHPITDIPGLAGGNHLAKYAGEIFPEIGQQNIKSGIIAIESQEPVAAVTLRQHSPSRPYPQDIYLLTIFPVVPLLP